MYCILLTFLSQILIVAQQPDTSLATIRGDLSGSMQSDGWTMIMIER